MALATRQKEIEEMVLDEVMEYIIELRNAIRQLQTVADAIGLMISEGTTLPESWLKCFKDREAYENELEKCSSRLWVLLP